jgi:hypothetical protein
MISGSLLEEIVDFVECWVHSILYARKIYPAVLFEQKRYQEISVWQSRHPDINAYIRRVIDNLRPLIEQVRLIFAICFDSQTSYPSPSVCRVLWTELSSTQCPALDNQSITLLSSAAYSHLQTVQAVAVIVTAAMDATRKRTC